MISPVRLSLPLALVACAHLVGCASSPPPAQAPTTPTSAATPPAPAPAEETFLDVATAKQLVKDGARLIDVRSPEEYATKHIEGAVNIPVDAIAGQDLGPKDAPIVLYCGSGRRAARAAAKLREKGYTRVENLGGMKRWDE